MRGNRLNSWQTIFVTWLCVAMVAVPAHATSSYCSQLFSGSRSEWIQKRLTYYNPFNLFQGKTVDAVELLGQDFYAPSERGAVVGISGYSGFRASLNQANGDFLSGKPFADGERVFHFDVKNPSEFFNKLLHVYKVSGPIYRLSIMGHGSPGAIGLGSMRLTGFWAWFNRGQLQETIPDDLFVENAEIVILSCKCAQGTVLFPDRGINRIKSIFSKFVRNGAKIVASRQSLVADTRGFDETDVVIKTRKASDAELSGNGIWTEALMASMALVVLPYMYVTNVFEMLWLDGKSKFDPIVVIDLPPKETLK